MQYNYSFEIASLLVACIIAVRYFVVQDLSSPSRKLFGLILLATVFLIAFDIEARTAIEPGSEVSLGLAKTLMWLYYIAIVAIPAIVMIYTASGTDGLNHFYKNLWFFVIPSALLLILCLTDPLTNFFFSITEGPDGLIFTPGLGSKISFAVNGFDLIFSLVLACIYKKQRGASNDMPESQLPAQALESPLQQALQNGEDSFAVLYQPIYDKEHRRYSNAEALLRLKGEDGELTDPSELLAAESQAVIKQADMIALKQVCRFLSDNKKIFSKGLRKIYVNILSNCEYTQMQQDIVNILNEYKVEPIRICLELSEAAVFSHCEGFDEFISEMRQKGFSFAVNKFSADYSKLSLIGKMPFDTVIIDEGMLPDLKDKKSCKLFEAVINVLNDICGNLVCTSVDTAEKAEYLKQTKLSRMQGSYYSEPVPGTELAKLINLRRL